VSKHDVDDLCEAVMARDEIARILEEGHGASPAETRTRVETFLKEMQTKQRHQIYSALRHPLYPIIRKITSVVEHPEIPRDATAAGRVVYVSNHKSHMDYLVQLLALENLDVRPPLMAAGINLFGGPLGLIHRHVTGAIPIRRQTKDPIYLLTLKAYIAEVLRRHDLFFYPEGGRSYSGEIKAPKTGLLHACLQANVEGMVVIPAAVSYDLVLEDRALARQGGIKKRQRPFRAEVAEMIASAVGYRTRAFITFGQPIPFNAFGSDSRKDVLDLAHTVRESVGRLYKVVPTALVANAMKPSITPDELEARVVPVLERLELNRANLAVRDPKHAVDEGVRALIKRGVIHKTGNRLRVRDRLVLRYYARTIQHLLAEPAPLPAADRT
jgi:glycerol-3-phosphate O-acyltransferase